MSVDETPKDEVMDEASGAAQDAVAATEEAAEAAVEEAAAPVEDAVAAHADDPVVEKAPEAAEAPVEEKAPEAVAAPKEEKAPEAEETMRRPAAKPAPEPKAERPKREHKPLPRPEAPKPAAGAPSLGMGAWIGICVAALILGVVIGKFLLGGAGAGGSLGGKLTVTEAELDTPMATYSSSVGNGTITAREVILQNSSLEAAKDAEGNYALPSADTVLSVARNAIIKKEAEKRGLAVTDEELAAYSEETLGSSDYASIATSYSMDEQSVKDLLTSSCLMSKLRDEVLGEAATTTATMPEAPAAPETKTETQVNPETGEEQQVEVDSSNTPTAEYAAYIIKLAGDEWDAAKGTWASTDGPFASALSSYDVKADSATYEAAQAAYYVAYQQYSEAQSEVSTKWSDFVNGLLSNSSIQISTLIA